MYYKLPVKERMELMKSYRKANPDMSYRDMVNDYNTSYQRFDNGGKKDNTNVVINKGLPIKSLEELKKESDKIIAQKKMLAALKSKDYAKEKTNYEETTRGANQMDGSGISSAELGWRYAKLTDPTFVSGAAEVIKDAYMGNKQNMLNLAGAIPIPYLSGASKFAKNVRKYYYLDKVGDITNKGQDIVQEFGNGGVKERDPIYVTDKNDPRLRAYSDSLNLYNKYNLPGVKAYHAVPLKKHHDYDMYTKTLGFTKEQAIAKIKENTNRFNKSWTKAENTSIKPIAYNMAKYNDKVNEHLPFYKKPVQPYIYKKPEEVLPQVTPQIVPQIPIQNIKPVVQDTVKYQPVIDNELTRRWNFNASNPTLEYYDKSNKLVKSEYYKNMNDFKQGKQIKQ